MTKRKNTGLIKYGTRKYSNKTQKFQEGGFAAVSQAYDWRDDPYEIMLLQQKAAEKNARIRSSGKKSTGTTKVPKIGAFKSIEGGLEGATEAANEALRGSFNAYKEQIKANGIDWVNSEEGQFMHQGIVNSASELEYKLKLQKKNFDDALGAIDDIDKEALAISSKGNIMVRDVKDPSKVGKISLYQYMQGVEKYEAMTTNEFANWKNKYDVSMDSSLEEEFLRKNAVDRSSIYDTFVKDFDDSLQYLIHNNKIMKKDNGDGSVSKQIMNADFVAGVKNIMNYGTFEDAINKPGDANTNYIGRAVTTIFSDIMEKNSSDKSRLLASLRAEVLRDRANLSDISKLGTAEEKMVYLDKKVKAALIQKVIDKGYKKAASSGGGSEGGEAGSSKANSFGYLGSLTKFADGTQTSRYTMGSRALVNGEERVQALDMPMVKGGISAADYKLTVDPKASKEDMQQNSPLHNDAVAKISDMNAGEVYTESGERLSDLLQNDSAVNDLLGSKSVITKNSSSEIIMMPFYKDGKMAVKEFARLKDVKMKLREAFLVSMKDDLKKEGLGDIPANQLIAGNTDQRVQKAYARYTTWIEKALNIKKFRASYDEKPTPENQRLLNHAADASRALNTASASVGQIFGNKPVMLQPVVRISITYDNDAVDIKDMIEDRARKNNYGMGTVKDLSPSEEEFINDVNKIDAWNPLGWFSDNRYKMNIFAKVKTSAEQAHEQGQKTGAITKIGEIDDQIKQYINSVGLVSNPDLMNTIRFAIN